MASMSKEVCTGLNILKKGQDPPLRPDDQLPDWCALAMLCTIKL